MKMIKDLFYFSTRNDSLGLCLSGGGALGFAHIGVIQSLEENGIYPTHIVGSSMGAIVGTLYAAGYSPVDMIQMIKEDKLYKITKLMTFRPTFLKSGLSTHALLSSLIKELIPHNSFEKLKKKMHICVANLNKAEWEIIDSGSELDKWVSASASIPGVFDSVRAGKTFYVDGGLLNNMPAQGIEDDCQNIIGVDVIPHKVPAELNKPIDSLAYAIRAMQHQNSKEGRDLCRFIIEPDAIEHFHEFNFDAFEAIYHHGYNTATKFITENPEIKKVTKAGSFF
ncbi:MAG: patatin-like phospholipase family protein [Bacteroidota bacterium]|nr:patatin-like phospholipase family protein [Bacteroidota bacterium]